MQAAGGLSCPVSGKILNECGIVCKSMHAPRCVSAKGLCVGEGYFFFFLPVFFFAFFAFLAMLPSAIPDSMQVDLDMHK